MKFFLARSMDNGNLQTYFRAQQVSLQWLPVLRAMAQELSECISTDELRPLFYKIGQRFANDTEDLFSDIQTLTELQESLNDFWARVNWGWVNLKEANGGIEITHQAAPLAEAFGDESLVWSIALLEGFYQTVFSVLGAKDTMAVRAAGASSDGMALQFRFGR
jgi:hypothetical protein